MTPNDETTLARSRAFSRELCARLERSWRLLQYWDLAIQHAQPMYFWQVRRRWGLSRRGLKKRRQQAYELMMEARITEVKEEKE